MCVVTNDRHNRFDLALFVKAHLRFYGIKINGTALETGGMQRFEERIQGV